MNGNISVPSSDAQIHWCSLEETMQVFVDEALLEFADRFNASNGIPDVQFEPLEESMIRQLRDFDGTQSEVHAFMLDALASRRAFIFVSECSTFAEHGKTKGELGAASPFEYAMSWTRNNKYVVWHEVMHLLMGLDDCYELNDGRACEHEDHCIMQAYPNETNCGGELTFCDKVRNS